MKNLWVRYLYIISFYLGLSFYFFDLEAKVSLGIDQLFEPQWRSLLVGKKIGLITNHTGISSRLESTIDIIYIHQKKYGYTLSCLFAPEHGLRGDGYACEKIKDERIKGGLPVFSLHGDSKRPTPAMLKNVDLLIFDIQDIGCRSYTYATTLLYIMEVAAAQKIPVLVLDRPNPLGGQIVDGPMLEKEYRSFVGYVDVPYCHGMTIGELAAFFNKEYGIQCDLRVIPMKGWARIMTFEDTGLQWIPTSPQIPSPKAALCYPIVGMLGELGFVSIGVGYTLPFQIVAAPWIDGDKLALMLKQYNLPGISFIPIHVRPFFGCYAHTTCRGVLLAIEDATQLKPFSVQCAIFHALRRCYPLTFRAAFEKAEKRRAFFSKIVGTHALFDLLLDSKSGYDDLIKIHAKRREQFMQVRKKYLIY